MNYETAVKAMKDRTAVTYNGLTGRLATLDSDGETILGHFVVDRMNAFEWVDILDVELAEQPAELSPVSQMTLRDLVERLVTAEVELDRGYDQGANEDRLNGYIADRDAARTEIHRRLDAIQMYQGTEATIIKLILSGQKSGS